MVNAEIMSVQSMSFNAIITGRYYFPTLHMRRLRGPRDSTEVCFNFLGFFVWFLLFLPFQKGINSTSGGGKKILLSDRKEGEEKKEVSMDINENRPENEVPEPQ